MKYFYKSATVLFLVIGLIISNPIHLKCDSATKKYTIVYNSNGGKGSMSNTIVTYGKPTNLRANSFTRSGYLFQWWYAHRKSDGKWLCKNKLTGKNSWISANALSRNNNYEKFLYNNKASVSKTSSVNGDVVTMYAQWKKIYTLSASKENKYVMALNDHGFTVINMYCRHTDKYTLDQSYANYFYRSIYAYAKAGRIEWDNPYKFSCSNIWYTDSKGNTIKNFKMTNIKDNIFPNNVFGKVSRENKDIVKLKRNNKYYGNYALNLTCQYALNPYAKTFTYKLNT